MHKSVWLVSAACLFASATAQADDYIGGMIFGVYVGVPLGLIGTGGAVVVGLSDSDSGRPSTGAMTYALTAGTLNVLWGSFLVYAGTQARDNEVLAYGPGVFDLAVGITSFSLAIYRNSRPQTKVVEGGLSSVSLAPLHARDVRGNTVAGISLRLTNF